MKNFATSFSQLLLPNFARILCLIILFLQSSVLAGKPPYPIIFVHGGTGSDETFSAFGGYLNSGNPDIQWGDIGVFDVLLNADDNLETSNFASDVAWEDFQHDGHNISLGRRNYNDDWQVCTDGWSQPTESISNIFFANFKEERIRGTQVGSYFHESDQAAVYKMARACSVMVAEVLAYTQAEKVVLVGHSMGGLAIREYLQRTDAQGNHRWWQNQSADGHKVAKVVTVNSPLFGTNGWFDPTMRNEGRSDLPPFLVPVVMSHISASVVA